MEEMGSLTTNPIPMEDFASVVTTQEQLQIQLAQMIKLCTDLSMGVPLLVLMDLIRSSGKLH